ncbi:type II secretion system inner membrane protein GspF [Pseudomonas sp. Teo4]|uniref:type II secretion system inner membrane protein GspF n=1 Tax=Pseudomonas sp. Teo4 TaxID=3064528 RepID=UPI002ABAC228|nr:type II secretion system inner membrane protein GspF [Pseudomonas sp. Teo4]MDZ3994221.1 putative type II secretion system protein F [Pseudomonas sp. Teo4]
MAMFSFHAHDASGKRRRGRLEAGTDRQARQMLRDRGWQVLSIRQVPLSLFSRLLPGERLTASQRSLLSRQLATLLNAGMPLAEALQALTEQSEHRQVRLVMRGVADRIAEGNTLADALAHHHRAFPLVYRATVAAAERSGHLADVFERLAEHAEQQQAMRQKVLLAMVYPLILAIVSVLVVGFLLGYVVPDVVQAFTRDQAHLPTATRVLITLSDVAASHGLLAAIVTVALAGLGVWALREPARRRRWHGLKLHVPWYRDFICATDAARFASTLAILGRSGVALVEAMYISASVVGNLVLRERLQKAAREMSEGATLAGSLTRSATLPPLMLHMIASGERAGELDTMLTRAAELQEKHLAARISLLVSLCEPLLLLVMGGIVLFIVLAILLPILNLNQLVN